MGFAGDLGLNDPFFGAACAINFEKFRYFSEKLPYFVKVEDLIA